MHIQFVVSALNLLFLYTCILYLDLGPKTSSVNHTHASWQDSDTPGCACRALCCLSGVLAESFQGRS